MTQCKECKGTGAAPCPKCNGRAVIFGTLGGSKPCKHCAGHGKIKCNVCGGKGKL